MRGRRRQRGRWLLAALVLVVLAGAGVAAWLLWPRTEPPSVAAGALANGWSAGRIADAPVLEATSVDVAERYDELTSGLDAGPPSVTLLRVAEPVDGQEQTTATYQVAWELAGDTVWSYETTATLHLVEDAWRIEWTPTLVHPRLEAGLHLATRRLRPARGEILAADGTPIVTQRPVVEVGVQPSRATDPAALAATLAEVLGIDGAALEQRIAEASPDAFVPVITLREDDYAAVKDRIHDLPGTVFRRDELALAPTREFARAVLGRAGPVTAELLEQHPDRYVEGDVVGLSGLQAAYDERLFGQPGLQVVLDGEQPSEDPVVFEQPAVPGDDVTISLDEAVQIAADEAVAGTGFPTALVAMRLSDGHVLAVANSEESGGFNLGFEGRVPPGSTFKIVTTAALLRAGVTPDETVACPATTTLEGRTIGNAEDQVLGEVPFRTVFARSCNTAFVELSRRLEPGVLAETAADFGIGHEAPIGVDAFMGEVPETQGPLDLGVSAIGQGRIQVSPLAMTGVAATVANGQWIPPRFVLEPDPGGDVGLPPPLDPQVASTLQELTRLVVTDGSATAVAGAAGPPVHGKTGTAEYGAEDPPRTHAWFVGYQGDLAFAVLVAETPDAFGGTTAAPIAARFLAAIATPPADG